MMPLAGALKRCTPAQRDYVAWLRAGSPEAKAHTALLVHGIDVSTWRCECGRAYEYPASVCQGCRRCHPRVCATSGCGEVIKPPEYGDVPPYCAHCTADFGRKARAESFARFGIGPRERLTAQGWAGPEPHQVAAVAELESWLASGVWKRGGELTPHLAGPTAYFIGGLPGRGKSVLAAWLVHRAYVDLGLVSSFRWHSQAQLALIFAERHSRDTEAAKSRSDQALATWRAIGDTPLLVVDDLFADRLTPAFGEALASLLRERLDHGLPSVLTSNHPPHWQSFFETDVGRLQSRWQGYGRELVLNGPDLRARAA